MASHPRVNSSLVIAIRMAKMSKSFTTKAEPLKVYHFVHNQNRPDKAFTTERAKRGGNSNACSGKIFVTVPSDHFGPILAENDPVRKQGVLVGECWEDRMECRQWGTHLPHVAGIAGQSDYGAQSVALSGGYEDDEDHGEWFLYTGSGGRDLSGNKRTNKDQSFDQKFEKYNEALRVSCMKGYPVRVVRSHKEKRSSYAPEKGVRYDGVYRIEKCWRKVGIQGYKVCRYLFVRCDNEPAPWTSDERGDQPRPLPVIKELKKATDITERKEKPSWDFDEVEGCWKWKRTPPMSRKRMDTGDPEERQKAAQLMYSVDPEERQRAQRAKKKEQILSVRERLLKEFSCLICRKVMTLPLTTPCAHNFCKHCLEGAFAGQTFVKERNCEGRRTLRAQKNIMKCPHCPIDISDFLKNPQINRELMDVIESLRIKTEENVEETEADVEESSKEESDSTDKKPEAGEENIEEAEADVEELSEEESYRTDKKPEAGVEMEVCTENLHELEGGKKTMTSPIKSKPTLKKLGSKQNEISPMKKCDVQSKDKKDSSLEDKIPESGKEKLQTPTTGSLPKRKKADNDNCGSSGVRTRSMRSKELIDEENDSRLEKSKGTRPYKKKKLNFADSGSEVVGVRTRSQISRD
ncbi:E3 ubiquitin-protein ligase orthrus 2-like [Thalictrum thalictroides]|uniref:RING-type E3 ubiquitin transferase n=1 Tax=Thalictrum thalictroides TaxID=46969 RepID=A0A7J6WUA3_THATH|nr:E3 ubiquitin-protein ligase orthrus 2-like [Thalictrum thalictroides]